MRDSLKERRKVLKEGKARKEVKKLNRIPSLFKKLVAKFRFYTATSLILFLPLELLPIDTDYTFLIYP
jgi:hypothetical protein